MYLNELEKMETKDFLELAYLMVNRDGEITKEERKMFDSYRAETNLSKQEYQIQNKPLKIVAENLKRSSKKVQKIILLELSALALSDDEYAKEEEEMMNELLNTWKIETYEFKRIKRWVEGFNDLLVEGYVLIEDKK